jgi:hypothetical protein
MKTTLLHISRCTQQKPGRQDPHCEQGNSRGEKISP